MLGRLYDFALVTIGLLVMFRHLVIHDLGQSLQEIYMTHGDYPIPRQSFQSTIVF